MGSMESWGWSDTWAGPPGQVSGEKASFGGWNEMGLKATAQGAEEFRLI